MRGDAWMLKKKMGEMKDGRVSECAAETETDSGLKM